jgi:outer membrane protein TolC
VKRQWRPSLVALLAGAAGCAHPSPRSLVPDADSAVVRTAFHPGEAVHPPSGPALATATELVPPELTGPQPVDVYIRRALAENRTIQAAYHNVQSLKHRIPQVTSLDDPVLSNTIFPIPAVAPQYSLMGYNPYNATLAQQFPWFGTLRLRGEIADRDVRVALAELAVAQLDAVTAVRRTYFDLHAAERTGAILTQNRKVLELFRDNAKARLATGGSQQDVIRAEILIAELDRILAGNLQDLATARALLARQIHVSPQADLKTLSELPAAVVPAEIDRLYQLALSARPELRGRLEAIARDQKAVELAQKRFYPNITLGLTYMDMEKTNALTPKTAGGFPNVGMFVALNLPVYRAKYRAGVCEAQERTLADTKLYEAEQDEANSEIQDSLTQARVQQNVLSLLRDGISPRANHTLELATTDFQNGNVDIATLLAAEREVIQVEVQIAQIEAELGKALAALERAVGLISAAAPEPHSAAAVAPPPPPTPPSSPGPFSPSPSPAPLEARPDGRTGPR